jgi:hypothetical protein
LIAYTTHDSIPTWKGYFYACLMFVATLTQTLSIHQHWDIVFRVGMKIRSSVIAAVFSKVCCLRDTTHHATRGLVGERSL